MNREAITARILKRVEFWSFTLCAIAFAVYCSYLWSAFNA